MTGEDHPAGQAAEAALADAFTTCWTRVIAAAFRVTNDLDLAEEAAAADVFGAACGRWLRRLRVARAHLTELGPPRRCRRASPSWTSFASWPCEPATIFRQRSE